MKELNNLYKILLADYKKNGHKTKFICSAIDYLLTAEKINEIEHSILTEHFLSQYPTETLHPEFYESDLFYKTEIGVSRTNKVWFESSYTDGRGQEIRIKFLEKMILITKPKKIRFVKN